MWLLLLLNNQGNKFLCYVLTAEKMFQLCSVYAISLEPVENRWFKRKELIIWHMTRYHIRSKISIKLFFDFIFIRLFWKTFQEVI